MSVRLLFMALECLKFMGEAAIEDTFVYVRIFWVRE